MLRSVGLTLKYIWEGWKVLARKIGTLQARIILTIIYGIIILPVGLCVRLFGDPLRIKKLPDRWLDQPDKIFDMEWARRQ